jgi:hypothetical protein
MYNDQASHLWLNTALNMLGIQGEDDLAYAYSTMQLGTKSIS